MEVQITECKGFIARARSEGPIWLLSEPWRWRLSKNAEPGCNVWRRKCRGRPRLWRTPPRNQTARIWAAELEQLRRKMNELQIQNLELQGSCKRQAVGISTP